MLQFLRLCGGTLKSLDISRTVITGDTLVQYTGSLPCLENLNCGYTGLTEEGLLQFLRLCGGTLKSLDIRGTDLTGDTLVQYTGSFPCLENLVTLD